MTNLGFSCKYFVVLAADIIRLSTSKPVHGKTENSKALKILVKVDYHSFLPSP